mgnify:CR=1 FL=1
MSAPADPIELFKEWFQLARAQEPDVPDAVAVATSASDGRPSVRMMLLKGVDADGFVLYTNFGSRKGAELADNGQAALWKSLHRQVRVEGPVQRISDAQADAYFESRDRESRIGAWASQQSRPVADRAALEARFAECNERFGDGPVSRPPFWSGFRVQPERVEFWEERPARLHDRFEYRRVDGQWARQLLQP